MSPIFSEQNIGKIEAIVEEQKSYYLKSAITNQLESAEILGATTIIQLVEDEKYYKGVSAELEDNPKQDTLTFNIEVPTVEDLADDFASPEGLSQEDILRLYVGMGIGSMLIVNSLRPTRIRNKFEKMENFFATLSRSQGIYARSMESRVFKSLQADEAASMISTDGHDQTARVNALRLQTGMFVEVQPDPKKMRQKVTKTFEDGLEALFEGKELYVATLGLFNVGEQQAKKHHTNTVETLMGLAFPMTRRETRDTLNLIK